MATQRSLLFETAGANRIDAKPAGTDKGTGNGNAEELVEA
jgi:hypothetical protein